MIDDSTLLESFVEESRGHLASLEPDLLELEETREKPNPEVVNRAFRSIHSLKGASGFFGLQKIGTLSHTMENLLSLLRDGKTTITEGFTDALLSGVDKLRAMVEDVGNSETYDIEQELEAVQKLIDNAGGSVPTKKLTVTQKSSIEDESAIVEKTFDISENVLKSIIRHGQFLYSIRLSLKKDFQAKGRTPFDYITEMQKLGDFVDSFLDHQGVGGLNDAKDNDLAFVFLFATVMDDELVPIGLEVEENKIHSIDLSKYRGESGKAVESLKVDADSGKTTNSKDTQKKQESPQQEPSDEEPEAPDEEVSEEETTPQAEPAATQTSDNKPHIQVEEKIRVGVNVLNELLNLAGELVLGRNQLNQILEPHMREIEGLGTVLPHVSRITTEMQEKIMQLRMQPIALVFNKFNRVVRDLSRKVGVDIRLEISGEDVELDKSIIEGLSDPLTHLIRNAVDHGIEKPDARKKQKKSPQGVIHLKAYHQGGQVHIDVIDDGKGLDPEVIGKKAIEKGIVTKEKLDSMSDKEINKLIFKAGFSTAKQVSDVSGRGVGMDVVITNVEHLGGVVDLESKPGKGTTVSIVLPLTLSIVSGLTIRLKDRRYVIPEVNIDQMVRLNPEQRKTEVNKVQDTYVLRRMGRLLPLISLSEALGTEDHETIEQLIKKKEGTIEVLILHHGGGTFCMVVDQIEQIEEIVVKPLPQYLKRLKSYSGATIMGDGTVALILDIVGIAEKMSVEKFESAEEEEKEYDEKERRSQDLQTLLLFDNDTQEQFALPLELIQRIEQIDREQIEYIEDKPYLQYRGDNLRLIHLEDYLPVTRPENDDKQKLGVIIPKQMKYPIGILINQVIDTIEAEVELDTKTFMAPGLFGSTVLNDKISLLIDMYRLFEMAAPEWFKPGAPEMKRKKKQEKTKILLVEDTPFFRMVESDYLKSAGYEVLVANDGREALNILAKTKVDGVVCDILMPHMDGWGFIEAVRSDDNLKDLPVLAVTSVGDDKSVQKGYEAGFDEWETKLNKTRLLDKLEQILQQKKQTTTSKSTKKTTKKKKSGKKETVS